MKYFLIISIILITGCQSGYTPSIVRAGTDLGITILLNEKKLTVTDVNKLHETLSKLITNKDLTIVMYNEKVRMLLSQHPGAAALAGSLLIVAQANIEQKITPEYRYIVSQGLNQMKLAVVEWDKWKNLNRN